MTSRARPPPLDLSPQTPKDEFAFQIDLQSHGTRNKGHQEFATLSPSYLLADSRFNFSRSHAIAEPSNPPSANILFKPADASSPNSSRFLRAQDLTSLDPVAVERSSTLPDFFGPKGFPTSDFLPSNTPSRQHDYNLPERTRHDLDTSSVMRDPPSLDFLPSPEDTQNAQKSSCTLWLGDLEVWMSEEYIKSCVNLMGLDRDATSTTGRVDVMVKLAKNNRQSVKLTLLCCR